MSAITTMLEAALGSSTELTHACELVRSSGHCASLEPRWWVVDIGVRARVLDTSAGAVLRPGPHEFRSAEFGTRAPLHLSFEVGLLDRQSGSSRTWLVDMTSMRTYVFASSITINAIGPASMAEYKYGGDKSMAVPRDVLCRIEAGLWPADTEHQRVGVPGSVVRGCNCTIRVFLAADAPTPVVPIPPGARTLAIFDSSGSSSPWAWQLGESPAGRSGLIHVLEGQTIATALVPNLTHVVPVERVAVDREVLLVFGVEL